MKTVAKYVILVALCFFFMTWYAFGQLDPPKNIDLTPDIYFIKVEWDEVQGAEYYIIHWGLSRHDLDYEIEAEPQDTLRQTYTIEELDPGTEYFVAISAESQHHPGGERSEVKSTETLQEDRPPQPPENFWITGIDDITGTSVVLQWNESPDQEIIAYKIYYSESSGDYETFIEAGGSETTATVEDLYSGTRYYFNISAVDKAEDETQRESEMAGEIIVDTLPDEHPPDIPARISGLMTGENEITVSVDPGNKKMVDFKGIILSYGQVSGDLTEHIDIESSKSHVFEDLPIETTWYFTAAAYDYPRNETENGNETENDEIGNISDPTGEISVKVEKIDSYTGRYEDFRGGCFIANISGRKQSSQPEYDVTEYKNKTGISGGFYIPSESGFKDFYGRDNYPVFLFYERSLHRHLSMDFRAGYMRSTGNMRTADTDSLTGIDGTFTIMPTSVSVNFKFPIAAYIWGFAGAGPDYWYARESTELVTKDDTSEWVGGYHGRAGLWLYNQDPVYRRWGVVLETRYSVIDRFGKNDLDLGGWIFLLGGFYNF